MTKTVKVNIRKTSLKMEFDIDIDITIMNENTGKYVDKPKLNKSKKIAHDVMGKDYIFSVGSYAI